jgi:hypothetical protein
MESAERLVASSLDNNLKVTYTRHDTFASDDHRFIKPNDKSSSSSSSVHFHSQNSLLESLAAVLLLECLYELICIQEGTIGHAQNTSSTMVAVEHKHLRSGVQGDSRDSERVKLKVGWGWELRKRQQWWHTAIYTMTGVCMP